MKKSFAEESPKSISAKEAYITVSFCIRDREYAKEAEAKKWSITNFDNLTLPKSIATSGALMICTSKILRGFRELRVFI